MSKLEERESRRKSIVGGMLDTPDAPATDTASRGRPKEDRELKKENQSFCKTEFVRGYSKNCVCAACQY